MRLRATVRNLTGNTTHFRAERGENEIEASLVPDPQTLEIVEQEGAIYLLRLNDQGECVADTWHETITAAKAQAAFEFGTEERDWRDAEQR